MAEMALRCAAQFGYDWIVFLETPTELPTLEGKPPIVFTNNSEVLKVMPNAILLEIPEMDDNELANYLLLEVCIRKLVPPGQYVLFSRLNGGVEDLLGKVKKVPEWPILIHEETVGGTVEFARTLSKEGIGAAFLVGDTRRVLKLSEEMYPLRISKKVKIWDKNHWEFFKKIAKEFDGAFVISSKGEVVEVCRRLKPKAEVKLEGLGTRHHAVAAMTLDTKATGVVVSEEDSHIRIFMQGRIFCTIGPPKG